MDLTNLCYFVQEKHIRRPYLAFDDVLGDALQVFSLFFECTCIVKSSCGVWIADKHCLECLIYLLNRNKN